MQNIVAKYNYLESSSETYIAWDMLKDGIISAYIAKGVKTTGFPAIDLFPIAIDVDDNGFIRSLEIFYNIFPWYLSDSLMPPVDAINAEVSLVVVDDSNINSNIKCLTNQKLSWLYFSWKNIKNENVIRVGLGKNLILDINDIGQIFGLWILQIPDNIRNYIKLVAPET